GEQSFLIVGPHWQGHAPFGADIMRSPTNVGWLLARIQTGGPAEYGAVNQFQAGMTATPMAASVPAPALATPPRRGAAKPSTWPNPSAPGTSHALTGSVPTMTSRSYVTWEPNGSPGEQVAAMSPATFFTLF